MVEQPSGTVTLVFSDVEGSTRLLRELGPEPYRQALAEHRGIVREAASRHAGYEVDYQGDGFFYAFGSAEAAVAAVAEATEALTATPIRIRVGIHTGEPALDPPKYVGLDVHLAARVMSVGHGGQVLLSRATKDSVAGDLLDLGEHRLKDIPDPVWLYQLGSNEFPPLRSLNNTNLPVPASSFLAGKRISSRRTRCSGAIASSPSAGPVARARRASPSSSPRASSPASRTACSGCRSRLCATPRS